MPRPPKNRMVQAHPEVTYFKPQGVPMRNLKNVVLPVEGLEALRLADLEGLEQEEAAGRMKVSRPTFSRILASARRSVAEALVNGMSISIEGGNYVIQAGYGRGGGSGGGRGRGRGWGGL